jgi:hypothetical protein
MTRRLDPAEYERARTFLVEIAQTLLPEGTTWRTEGDQRRAGHSGGLSINCRTAAWHFWGEGEGGYSPIILIAKLRPGYSFEECVVWLKAFLETHPGTGSCTTEPDDDDSDAGAPSPASVARAREVLDTMQRAEGTPAETYLRSRGVEPPFPDCFGYIEDARCGEGALVAVLTAHERKVGVQVGYLTPDGKKSLVSPQRERFHMERQKGAIFRLPPTAEALAGPRDPVFDFLIGEGIEDALTLRQLGRPCTVLGLPGIGTLSHLDLPKKSRVGIFEDGDAKDSPADLGCIRGIDHLLDAGMYVWTVPTPLGLDANAILTEPNLGIEELRRMLRRENLRPGELSFQARITKLAQRDSARDPVAFAHERTAISKIFKVSVATIDAALKKLRPKAPPPGGAGSTGEEPAPPPDPPWEKTLPPLSTMLDNAVAATRRFLVADDFHYHVIALWTLVTHLVHSAQVALPIMPQLAFQSRGHDSGKSTALEITATLALKGQARSSYTASTLFRRIAEHEMTFCLSELHNILTARNTEMRAIVDACHRRTEAFIDRTETDSKGRRYVVTYRCWAALAWASIGPMVREVQSRAIVLPVKPALPDEYRKLDHTSPSKYPALIDTRRQYAAWAATINQPLDRALPPELFNRLADNWRPLFSVAALAGGKWPDRVKAAMEEVEKAEKTPSRNVRLLTSIQAALLGAEDSRLGTADLIDRLCADEEAGWAEANHGRRITAYWLRENLRGLLDPKGSQDWYEGKEPDRKHVRGYELHQFNDAILRSLSLVPLPASGSSGSSVTDGAKAAETAEFSEPDDAGASGSDAVQEKANKSAEEQAVAPDEPDEPDTLRVSVEEETKDGEGWLRTSLQRLDRPGALVLVTMIEGRPHYTFDDGTLVTGRTGKALSAAEFRRLDLVPIESEGLLEDSSPQRYVLRRQAEIPADLVSVARVSLIITQAQKLSLCELGYSNEQIREMTPATAHQLLGLGGAAESDDTDSVDEWSWVDEVERAAAAASSAPVAEKLAEKLSSGSTESNGPAAAPTVKRGIRRSTRKDTIRDAVLAYAREHPDWSAKDISKVVPRTASAIQRILDTAMRDSSPGGTT